MGKITEFAKKGDTKAMYQAILENLAETLESGCEAYTKAGICKQIAAIEEKLTTMAQEEAKSEDALNL